MSRLGKPWHTAILLGIALAPAIAPTAIAQTSRPSAAAKASDLARYVPAKGLIGLLEYDGTDAHASAWRKTALYRLLNDTKLGAMIEDLATQAIDQGLARSPGGAADKPKAAEILKLAREVFADGLALGFFGGTDKDTLMFVWAVRDGDRNGARAMLERVLAQGDPKPTTEVRGRRTIHLSGAGRDAGAWWVEGRDLIITPVPAVDAVIEAIEGKAPSATKHPIRAELARPEPGFEAALTAFFDPSSIPVHPDVARIGLDGVKRVDYRWGFQDEAIYSVLNVEAPTPRKGVLSLLDSKAFPRFDRTSLPAVPAGVSEWATVSLDPAPFWAWLSDRARKEAPPGGRPPGMIAFEQAVPQILGGLRLKEDVLAPLGPRWTFHADIAALAKGGKGRGALTVDLRDAQAAATAVDRIIDIANQVVAAQAGRAGRPKPVEFVKLPGAIPGYRAAFAPGAVPPNLAALAPTIVVGKKRLAIGLDEAEARAATAAPDRWKPGPEYAPVLARIPGNLVALTVSDPRATLPQQITGIPLLLGMMNAAAMAQARPGEAPFTVKADPAKVPTAEEIRRHLAPGMMAVSIDDKGLKVVSRETGPSLSSPAVTGTMVGLLLPAVQAAREAARRSQSMNNYKQIGLAMHNYHSTQGTFPPAAIAGKDGKPLLSWRVSILPYLGFEDLYKEFRLDEPWDSPHNKALIPKIPPVYINPSRPTTNPGDTAYLAFVGPNAALDARPTKLQDFTDGTSSTVMVADSTRAVPWTKPEDTPFDLKAQPSLLGAGSPHPGGFNALFVDGSVRFIKNTISVVTFHALVSRNGGEVVEVDGF